MTPAGRQYRLTVDITPLLEDQWTGIPVFTRRLVTALQATEQVNLAFALRLTQIPEAKAWDIIHAGSGTSLRIPFEEMRMEGLKPVDPDAPLLYPSVKFGFGVARREASTVHDVSTLVMPDTHEEANIRYHLDPLREQLATDDVVFCASEATRAALTAAFPSVNGRARVMHQYVDWPSEFEVHDYNLPRLRLRRYAVVIGTIEPRKNLGLLFRAFSDPAIVNSDLQFIVLGRRGWNIDQALAGLDPKLHSRIKFTGFVSEFVKYRLIKAAEFLVFPSIYEGFGIPALEAMSLGKPVLSAFTSSLPEVIGDAGIFFDPFSVREFVEAFKEISNPARLKELSAAARAQASLFNPARMVAPVLEWLESRE